MRDHVYVADSFYVSTPPAVHMLPPPLLELILGASYLFSQPRQLRSASIIRLSATVTERLNARPSPYVSTAMIVTTVSTHSCSAHGRPPVVQRVFSGIVWFPFPFPCRIVKLVGRRRMHQGCSRCTGGTRRQQHLTRQRGRWGVLETVAGLPAELCDSQKAAARRGPAREA